MWTPGYRLSVVQINISTTSAKVESSDITPEFAQEIYCVEACRKASGLPFHYQSCYQVQHRRSTEVTASMTIRRGQLPQRK